MLRAYVYNAFSCITRLYFSVYRIRHSEVWLCLKNARKCPLSWEVRSGWLLLPPEKPSSVRFTLFLFFYTLAHLKKKALVPELLNNEIVHLHMSQPFNTTKLRSNTARGQWILGSSYHSLFLVNLALAFGDGPPNKIVSRIEKLASMSCSQVTWVNFRNCTVRGRVALGQRVVHCPLQTLSI